MKGIRKEHIAAGGAPEGPAGLLKLERIQGYPAGYLLARIRGRRSRLIRDWRPVLYDTTPLDHLASSQYQGFVRERTPEGMWRALLLEHGWVYRQMDEHLRQAFATYFLYAELRTVFICLRCLEGGKAQTAGEVLGASLLSAEAQAILREGEVESALAGVERLFGALSPLFAGLAEGYAEKGMRETERFLTHRYLAYVTGLPLHPVLRGFFKRIIDSRNILALYKALRTGGPREGIFLAGGNVPVERLAVLLEKEDILEVAGLVREAAGVKIASPEPTLVEVALYRGITRFLAGAGRDPLDEALILDYLWRCQLEVMNLSMLLAARGLERDEAAAELVR
jgi:vacuolar-type H+-ATPase subunit C/Vma6